MAVNCDLITQDIRYISLPSWGYETHKKQNNDTPKKNTKNSTTLRTTFAVGTFLIYTDGRMLKE